MKFDGEEVREGDAVYDVAYGHGTVERVAELENKLTCNFNGRKVAYTAGGVGNFNRKTLFWRDPIGNLVPSKDKAKWDHFERLRDAVARIVL